MRNAESIDIARNIERQMWESYYNAVHSGDAKRIERSQAALRGFMRSGRADMIDRPDVNASGESCNVGR